MALLSWISNTVSGVELKILILFKLVRTCQMMKMVTPFQKIILLMIVIELVTIWCKEEEEEKTFEMKSRKNWN